MSVDEVALACSNGTEPHVKRRFLIRMEKTGGRFPGTEPEWNGTKNAKKTR